MIEAGFFVVLLVGGYIFGRLAEKRHMKSIIKREAINNALPAIASRHPPTDQPYHQHLVGGSVVIGSDYFKSFMSGLINIFGGRVTPFETLLDRARREAMLRMKEEARRYNAAYVFNVKYETTRVATGKVAAMEVFAYGTAMIPGNRQLSSVISSA
ncbi:MAG: heavy metal-binding domain-containing protein [Granulosicoccus sp.]